MLSPVQNLAMTDILHDLPLEFAWIWAKDPKSKQTLAEVVEDALVRFQKRFERAPTFALVHVEETLDAQILEQFNFCIFKSKYVLKNTVVLGVNSGDCTTKTEQTSWE